MTIFDLAARRIAICGARLW